MLSVLNSNLHQIVGWIVQFASSVLLPTMCLLFLIGGLLRWIIFFITHCQLHLAIEFEKRVHKYLSAKNVGEVVSFHQSVRNILETTHHDTFEMRGKHRRRRLDRIRIFLDSVFHIEDGVSQLVKETVNQVSGLPKGGGTPRFVDVSKYVFSSNPVFSKALRFLPVGVSNDLVNILPGLLVVAGMFGTFTGVIHALPQLSQMDITDLTATRAAMDKFVVTMTHSMGISVLGIVLSVGLTLLNSVLSPDGDYVRAIDKFASSLEFLWAEAAASEVAEVPRPQDRRAVMFSNPTRIEAKKVEPPANEITPAPEVPAPVVVEDAPPIHPEIDPFHALDVLGDLNDLVYEDTIDPEEFRRIESLVDEAESPTSGLEEAPPLPPPVTEAVSAVLHTDLSQQSLAMENATLDPDPEIVGLQSQLDSLDREIWKISDSRSHMTEDQWKLHRERWQTERDQLAAEIESARAKRRVAA